MNTIEGNKLIAEFLEGKQKKHPGGLGNMGYQFPIAIANSDWWSNDSLKFHSSWDWLMPVVEKIHSLTNVGISLSYKIDEQYKVVISWINWYNEQQKKSTFQNINTATEEGKLLVAAIATLTTQPSLILFKKPMVGTQMTPEEMIDHCRILAEVIYPKCSIAPRTLK